MSTLRFLAEVTRAGSLLSFLSAAVVEGDETLLNKGCLIPAFVQAVHVLCVDIDKKLATMSAGTTKEAMKKAGCCYLFDDVATWLKRAVLAGQAMRDHGIASVVKSIEHLRKGVNDLLPLGLSSIVNDRIFLKATC